MLARRMTLAQDVEELCYVWVWIAMMNKAVVLR